MSSIDESLATTSRNSSSRGAPAARLAGGRVFPADGRRVGQRLVQGETVMHRPDGLLSGIAIHEQRDLDLAGGDHSDVDARVCQRLEHLGSHAGMRPHPDPDG
jgi:hypothetical protein